MDCLNIFELLYHYKHKILLALIYKDLHHLMNYLPLRHYHQNNILLLHYLIHKCLFYLYL